MSPALKEAIEKWREARRASLEANDSYTADVKTEQEMSAVLKRAEEEAYKEYLKTANAGGEVLSRLTSRRQNAYRRHHETCVASNAAEEALMEAFIAEMAKEQK